ncbi:MAG: long-chain acyl-CoA synthetase [Salinisphaeraceae bacterium]|nr:long-chain acyl-CoA synthetase [Salinisphaeraceae bacterium]
MNLLQSIPEDSRLGDGRRMLGRAALHREIAVWVQLLQPARGTCVALLADNSPAWVICDLALQQLPAVALPLPPFFTPAQIGHALSDAGCRFVIIDRGRKKALQAAGFAVAGEHDGLCVLRQSTDSAGQRWLPGTGKITYTSGTTAAPKGVCLSNDVLIRLAGTLATALGELRLRRHMSVLPYATLLENVAGAYTALLAGSELLCPTLAEVGFSGDAGLDPHQLCHQLNLMRPESLILVPELLKALIVMREQGASLPRSLRFVAVGGGRLGPGMIERARAVGIPAYEGYGLSECGSVVSLNLPGADRPGSVGRPLPHVTCRVDDRGELRVTGSAMLGYVGGVCPGPDIATGDQACLDSEGFLKVQGRLKNQFITSFGRNVNPEWPESRLLQHPGIFQAAVFGEAMPCNVAVIVPAAGVPPVEIDRLVEAANADLPTYARIHRWLLADAPFSVANSLATANGRPRRNAIEQVYFGRIQAAAVSESTTDLNYGVSS